MKTIMLNFDEWCEAHSDMGIEDVVMAIEDIVIGFCNGHAHLCVCDKDGAVIAFSSIKISIAEGVPINADNCN